MRIFAAIIFIQFTTLLNAQQTDSVYYQLPEVSISAISRESQLRLLQSEGTITQTKLNEQPAYSLLPAINTIPGVRMEERSPGSYRLSIRGSLLRSPFGVRNVKIYLNDFPFTDAGGNTYLNSLDIGNINSLKILKGPESSIFGANTGGVVLIDPVRKTPDSLALSAGLSIGSYHLFHEHVFVQKRLAKHVITFNQAYQTTSGYRDNSGLKRNYLQVSDLYNYSTKGQLKILLLLSDMDYATPGGLTLQQFTENPKDARPPTATLPGAIEQRAAIFNNTVFGGIANTISLNKNWKHTVAITGSSTNFRNPFITNYEERKEHTYGVRTNFEYSVDSNQTVLKKVNIGGEWQQTNSRIDNYGNDKGRKTALQVADKINATQAFVFSRLLIDIRQTLLMEASASYNFFSYRYKTIYPYTVTGFKTRNFTPQLMPRFALSYKLNPFLSLRASASGGYSAPTIAEVRSSDNVINTNLQAETAQNYETGLRLRGKNDYLWVDISAFYYRLQNAIVRRVNPAGAEYFINAGGTKQPGLEAQFNLRIIKQRTNKIIRELQLSSSLTYNHFTFNNYKINTADYSNNKLTGVPAYTTMEGASLQLPLDFSIYVQHYHSARIALNDANTDFAKAYNLVQLKVSWKKLYDAFNVSLFAGIDNLLNEKYSLGNDLNAAGGRYYNAAPPRNYYGGIKFEL